MTTGATPFQHLFRRGAAETPPLLLLHGSGLDERVMTGFAAAVAPDATWIAPRGQVSVGEGWAFFRRHPDRTLDTEDLALRADQLCGFIAELVMRHGLGRPPVLAGFSNGAIMAAALLTLRPGLAAGAILMRPKPPWPERAFPRLDGLPVLILAGERDKRRDREDAPVLARQLSEAGAAVTACLLPAGHGETEADRIFAADWLARLATASPSA
ncbi:alpha/beta hydrolase [Inquilinus limosus]|uniref:alpha/beta hydrolase n=1 Tax=Inquilinus limosus TaxID=171674 RepID=UPI000415A4EA|nr:hypothetical protein [Inquilinus limosus]